MRLRQFFYFSICHKYRTLHGPAVKKQDTPSATTPHVLDFPSQNIFDNKIWSLTRKKTLKTGFYPFGKYHSSPCENCHVVTHNRPLFF